MKAKLYTYTFIGDYRACSLGLRSNSLTRFEEGAFKNVLQDLYDYQREFGDVDVRLSTLNIQFLKNHLKRMYNLLYIFYFNYCDRSVRLLFR